MSWIKRTCYIYIVTFTRNTNFISCLFVSLVSCIAWVALVCTDHIVVIWGDFPSASLRKKLLAELTINQGMHSSPTPLIIWFPVFKMAHLLGNGSRQTQTIWLDELSEVTKKPRKPRKAWNLGNSKDTLILFWPQAHLNLSSDITLNPGISIYYLKCTSGVRKMNQCNSFIYSLKSLDRNSFNLSTKDESGINAEWILPITAACK